MFFVQADVVAAVAVQWGQVGQRRGRKETYDWHEAETLLTAILDERGDYDDVNQVDNWKSQADAVRLLQDHFQKTGKYPEASITKKNVKRIVAKWRLGLKKN